MDWIKLDATELGVPLYESLGFREEGRIERWVRPKGTPPGCTLRRRFAPDFALDRQAFGADRSGLLKVLAGIESASVAGEGFAMGRSGSIAAYFGPCVARSASAARDLAAWFLIGTRKKMCIGIFSQSTPLPSRSRASSALNAAESLFAWRFQV